MVQDPTRRISTCLKWVSWEVKFVYAFIGLALFALVAFWLTGSSASQFQVDEGAIEAPEGVYDPVRAGEETPK